MVLRNKNTWERFGFQLVTSGSRQARRHLHAHMGTVR